MLTFDIVDVVKFFSARSRLIGCCLLLGCFGGAFFCARRQPFYAVRLDATLPPDLQPVPKSPNGRVSVWFADLMAQEEIARSFVDAVRGRLRSKGGEDALRALEERFPGTSALIQYFRTDLTRADDVGAESLATRPWALSIQFRSVTDVRVEAHLESPAASDAAARAIMFALEALLVQQHAAHLSDVELATRHNLAVAVADFASQKNTAASLLNDVNVQAVNVVNAVGAIEREFAGNHRPTARPKAAGSHVTDLEPEFERVRLAMTGAGTERAKTLRRRLDALDVQWGMLKAKHNVVARSLVLPVTPLEQAMEAVLGPKLKSDSPPAGGTGTTERLVANAAASAEHVDSRNWSHFLLAGAIVGFAASFLLIALLARLETLVLSIPAARHLLFQRTKGLGVEPVRAAFGDRRREIRR